MKIESNTGEFNNSPAQRTQNIMDLPEDERIQELRRLGAVTTQQPLPPSSHLKNTKTNVIFPWTPELARQQDILVCCDQYGNTDPEVWGATIEEEDEEKIIMQREAARLQLEIEIRSAANAKLYRQPYVDKNPVPQPTLQNGAVFLEDVDQLLNMVEK